MVKPCAVYNYLPLVMKWILEWRRSCSCRGISQSWILVCNAVVSAPPNSSACGCSMNERTRFLSKSQGTSYNTKVASKVDHSFPRPIYYQHMAGICFNAYSDPLFNIQVCEFFLFTPNTGNYVTLTCTCTCSRDLRVFPSILVPVVSTLVWRSSGANTNKVKYI